MSAYLARRSLYMVLLLFLSSVLSFIVITLPPGDYVDYIVSGGFDVAEAQMTEAQREQLRIMYGLDKPVYVQYLRWFGKVLKGDLGRSFAFQRPVSELIGERLGMTLVVSLMSLVITYAIAIPIGVYSAVRQYSIGDYFVTFIGFIGVSIPNFLLALVFMMLIQRHTDISPGGLFSREYVLAPWSWPKVIDLLKHLPLPVIVISLSGTAWLIRTMRSMMLDELSRPYVQTARAKGLTEWAVLRKYPLRVAVIPIVATVGFMLPSIFSGSTIVAVVLDLPTIGPLLLNALKQEDMFLGASVILVSTALTLVGTFISDVLLAWLDPRIRYT